METPTIGKYDDIFCITVEILKWNFEQATYRKYIFY